MLFCCCLCSFSPSTVLQMDVKYLPSSYTILYRGNLDALVHLVIPQARSVLTSDDKLILLQFFRYMSTQALFALRLIRAQTWHPAVSTERNLDINDIRWHIDRPKICKRNMLVGGWMDRSMEQSIGRCLHV